MKLDQAQILEIQQRHDSFCKTVLKNKAKNLYRDYIRSERGKNVEGVETVKLGDNYYNGSCGIGYVDKYPYESREFHTNGYKVTIRDSRLSNAIDNLSEKDQSIVLLYYVLELTEREIGKIVSLAPSTVNRRKKMALKLLEQYIKGRKEDEA